jgi:hypothetical protein
VGVVDFHNHLMPGVDDGAQDRAQALAGLRAMQADGVTELVATPHLEGMLTAARAPGRSGWRNWTSPGSACSNWPPR